MLWELGSEGWVVLDPDPGVALENIDIRELGGAIFGDFRYGTDFVYHNGAQSYYAARGFRCLLRV